MLLAFDGGLPAQYHRPVQPPPSAHGYRKLATLRVLRECRLFSGLLAGSLELIAAMVVVKRLDKGDYLFREGAAAEGFYVVQSGAINIHRVNPMGKEQVIAIFRSGQSFAEAAVASDGGYPADARALEASTVLLVPKASFIDLLRRDPGLALRMLGSMSLHLRDLVTRLDDMKLKDVESRLAHWLLKQCPQPLTSAPVIIELDRTKRVLAAELGTASETLSRTLAKWRDQQLVRVGVKSIAVLNTAALDALLRANLGENRPA